ncbi:MAG TPA: DUF6785 family protein, partial [Chthonomonadaceae bacterium]|nr:DUF6785 family protein [Chthonomonadaceae bacterium]
MAMAHPGSEQAGNLNTSDGRSPAGMQAVARNKAVTWRSVLICLLLLPINSYWVVQMEIVRYSAHPTTISLLFNTIFILLCLTVLNRLVARFAPRAALQRGELLLIYAILCIGSCVSGHDMLQVFVPMLSWSFKHANSSNGWGTLFNQYLKDCCFLKDEAIYKGYYLGNDTIWRWRYVQAWLPVVLVWTLFITVLLFVMLCINAILRKQWTE